MIRYCIIFLSITFLYLSISSATSLAQIPAVTSTLIRVIDTSQWTPPSPDPAGITYLSDSNSLLISDSEVDEMPIYQNANVFQSGINGNLISVSNTLSFSREPTDLAVEPSKNLYYFSDDDQKKITVVNLGTDKIFGTSDDIVRSFATTDFGCTDPEGIALGSGKLYIACGVDAKIAILNPGVNGIFDGVTPSGDDQATGFSTSNFNQMDPEGIEYDQINNSLFIVSTSAKSVAEVTTNGSIIRNINISPFNIRIPAGLEFAPSSVNPLVKNLYIVARGVDNNADPAENDGKIYEISFPADSSQISLTPTPSIVISRTPTPVMATNPILPTRTPTPVSGCTRKSHGDTNCDGLIDLIDFEVWRREFTGSATSKNADFNVDTFVDLIDFEIWRRSFTL